MNSHYLYNQIAKGKWFIHYNYALTMMNLHADLLRGVSLMQSGDRDGEEKKMITIATQDNQLMPLPSYDNAPEGSVAIIPLKDVMVKYNGPCGMIGTEQVATWIMQAGMSPKIDGVILDIDSGGGSVDSIPPLLSAIQNFKSLTGKPIVGVADLCASAAYYAGSHCDLLMAGNNLTSEFGSIGVMMQFMDVAPYYERQGAKMHRIYAPESNYKNLPFEKALKGEYDQIKEEELSPLALKFQNDVKTQRGSKLDLSVPGLLNGRMFYASNDKPNAIDAKQAGLIDEIGSLGTAISITRSMVQARKLLAE
jgi:protease IV